MTEATGHNRQEAAGLTCDPTQIQKELDETKIVLHKTIESVLERGEKIDSLVAKSDGLSAQSKMFYTQAKKQNSCCAIM
jgi:synaptobrevin homolog YKT6